MEKSRNITYYGMKINDNVINKIFEDLKLNQIIKKGIVKLKNLIKK